MYFIAIPASSADHPLHGKRFPTLAEAERWATDAAGRFGFAYSLFEIRGKRRHQRRLLREVKPAAVAPLPAGPAAPS